MADNIVAFDFSHLLYKHYYEVVGDRSAAQVTQRDLELAYNNAVDEIRQYQIRLKPNHTIIATDNQKGSWRVDYTKNNDLPIYKSTRTKKQTLKQKRLQQKFNKFRKGAVKQINKDRTVRVVGGRGLEADDLLAGLANNKNNSDRLFVVTSDKDATQLTQRPNTFVYNMRDGRRMTTRDHEFDMFMRSVRGRSQYGIPSAYPRIRESRLRDIYEDPGLMDEFRDEEIIGSDGVTRNVGEMIDHNRTLFDTLDGSPSNVQAHVSNTLRTQLGQ